MPEDLQRWSSITSQGKSVLFLNSLSTRKSPLNLPCFNASVWFYFSFMLLVFIWCVSILKYWVWNWSSSFLLEPSTVVWEYRIEMYWHFKSSECLHFMPYLTHLWFSKHKSPHLFCKTLHSTYPIFILCDQLSSHLHFSYCIGFFQIGFMTCQYNFLF